MESMERLLQELSKKNQETIGPSMVSVGRYQSRLACNLCLVEPSEHDEGNVHKLLKRKVSSDSGTKINVGVELTFHGLCVEN